MNHKVKVLQFVMSLGSALFVIGCSVLAAAPTATAIPPTFTPIPPTFTPVPPTITPTATPPPTATVALVTITTSLGDMIITKAEIVDENPMGEKAAPGYQILNVSFESADDSPIDGMDFYSASQEVYIIGDDGSKTESYMGGLVSGELIVGFTPPASAQTFTLYWPNNDPIELDLFQ